MTDLNFDYTKASAEDVPMIVTVIRALRNLSLHSGTITSRTQSTILRGLPTPILIAVATELNKPESAMAAVLAGLPAEAASEGR